MDNKIHIIDYDPGLRIRRHIRNKPIVPLEYVKSVNDACRMENFASVIQWAPEIMDRFDIPYASINGMMVLDRVTDISFRMLQNYMKRGTQNA